MKASSSTTQTAPAAAKTRSTAVAQRPAAVKAPASDSPTAKRREANPLVRHYLEANQYPPSSRPLTREMTDLLAPNQRYDRPKPLGAPGSVDDRVQSLRYLFTADRYFVTGDEAITLRFELLDGEKRVPVAVSAAQAQPLSGGAAVPLRFTAAADGSQQATLVPAKTELAKALGRVNVELVFAPAPQVTPVVAQLRFFYTPGEQVPARFTGLLSDRLDAGSVIVEAEVDVTTPGFYIIDANLFDASGEPVAWTRFKGELGPGAQKVPLRFFGKVLHDAQARSPYVLRDLRGRLHLPGGDPDRRLMRDFDEDYRTAAYALADISAKPWQNPNAEAQLRALRELGDVAEGEPVPK